MKKFFSKKTFLLFCSLILASGISLGQRIGGTSPVVTLVPTITHGTCSNPTGNVQYNITVSTGWVKGTKVNTLVLKDENGNIVYDHLDENAATSSSGSISNLPIGSYNFVGSVTVKNSSGQWISVPINLWIWIGIKTEWDVLQNMIASPNSYSSLRNASTQTYGLAYSKNFTAQSKLWMELKATYGSTTNNRLFWIIGETSSSTVFNPSGAFQYIEFYKTSSGNGIRVRQNNFGTYQTTTISTNQNDKVRVIRSQTGQIKLQLNDLPTFVYTFSMLNTNPMNIGVFALAQSDGCINALSSMECRISSDLVSHSRMKRKLDGGHTLAVGRLLKIVHEAEYETESNEFLNYKILDKNRNILASCDQNGTTSGGAIAYRVDFDDNRYEIELDGISGLITEEFYLLEVVDSKGDKRVLKFLFKY